MNDCYEDDESLDEWFQLGEDDSPEVGYQGLNRRDDGSAGSWPFWIERNLIGELCIHLHYVVVGLRDGELDTARLCALVKGASESPMLNDEINAPHVFNSY